MNLTLKVWRQKDANSPGQIVSYDAREISPDMSFLEMLDVINEGLIVKGEDPIAFDSDCREGICGACSLVINGIAHGGHRGTAGARTHGVDPLLRRRAESQGDRRSSRRERIPHMPDPRPGTHAPAGAPVRLARPAVTKAQDQRLLLLKIANLRQTLGA